MRSFGVYAERMPAKTVRLSMPMSSVSLRSLSASATSSASTMRAMRRSILPKSSMEMVSPTGSSTGGRGGSMGSELEVVGFRRGARLAGAFASASVAGGSRSWSICLGRCAR
jgi:hypothetical protein